MRWIFFSLVFLNVAMFIWGLFNLTRGDSAASARSSFAKELKGIPSLTLLSELEENTLKEMVSRKERLTISREEPSPEAADDKPLCTLVGPFKQLLKAEYFVERMSALAIDAEVQEVEIPGEVGYWVYLPPEISRKEALRRLHELQAKAVDSYVIPKGELANGISFGMFSQEELALKRLEDIKKEGYDAKIKEVARSYKEVWAILKPEQAQKLDDDLWQKVLSGNPGLDKRQNFCSGVASSENFH